MLRLEISREGDAPVELTVVTPLPTETRIVPIVTSLCHVPYCIPRLTVASPPPPQFYIASISVHALILAVNQFVSCFHNEWKECSIHTPPATVILLLFLIFEGALFGIFTLVMLCSQVQAIWTDETVRQWVCGSLGSSRCFPVIAPGSASSPPTLHAPSCTLHSPRPAPSPPHALPSLQCRLHYLPSFHGQLQ